LTSNYVDVTVTGFTTTSEADSSMDFTVSDVGCDLASYLNTSDGEVFAPSSPMKDMHFSADANDFKVTWLLY